MYYYFFARLWFSENCRRIHDFWGQPHTPHVMKKMADSGRQTSMSAKRSSSWILFICGDLENVLAIQVNNVEVSYSCNLEGISPLIVFLFVNFAFLLVLSYLLVITVLLPCLYRGNILIGLTPVPWKNFKIQFSALASS